MYKTIYNLPNYDNFEKMGVNTFTICDFERMVKNVSRETLKKYGFDETEYTPIINKIDNNLRNIPKTLPSYFSEYHFNNMVILNEYPLFNYYSLGDCVCIFLIRYYTPCVFQTHLYMVDCDGGIQKMDDDIFLMIYYNDDLLSL